jgi:hypothetical protein
VHAGRQQTKLIFGQQMIKIGADEFAIVDAVARQLLERPRRQRVFERLEGEQVVFRGRAKAIGPQRFIALAATAHDGDVQALLL